MANLHSNAGFLDGAAGWQITSGMTLAVDETVRGAAGRMALRGTGTSTASAQTRWLSATEAARCNIDGASLVEVDLAAAALVANGNVRPNARLSFYNASGGLVLSYDLPLTRPHLEAWGIALRGLPDTYWRSYGLYVRPGSATRASLEVGVTSTASGQSLEVLLLKPYIGRPSASRRRPVWGPGAHASEDLNLPNWPSDMPLLGLEGAQGKAAFIAHDAGTGLAAQRRASADPARKLTTRVRVNTLERDHLETFARTVGRFWITEPDTDKLCLAQFDPEGLPRMADHRGGHQLMEVTMWLETA